MQKGKHTGTSLGNTSANLEEDSSIRKGRKGRKSDEP
jgi:hypothetical protein